MAHKQGKGITFNLSPVLLVLRLFVVCNQQYIIVFIYLFSCLYLNKFLILVLQIWYHNVPHTKLAEIKGHQNWVKVDGEYLTFPGGGTQFKHGALHYIDFIQQVRICSHFIQNCTL